jgi:uncharacterized protein (DUF58 family)
MNSVFSALLALAIVLLIVGPIALAVWKRFVPTRRLALVVAALAPVWMMSETRAGFLLALGVTALLYVLTIADAVFTPGREQVDVRRELPPVVGVGEWAEARYELTSRWPRAVRVELHDAMPRGLERRFAATGERVGAAGEPPVSAEGEDEREVATAGPAGLAPAVPVLLAREREVAAAAEALRGMPLTVPAGGDASVPFRIAGRERGSHPLGPVVLRAGGPLGLVRRSLRYEPADAVTVAPSMAGVRRYRLLALQHRLRDAGIRNIRRRGEGTTFANLREYAVGDDPRHIDWKATARRRKVVTREFTVEQGQTVLLAVDAGRLMTQFAGPLPRFEYALSAAQVLADVAVHSGDQVGLILFDDEVRAFVPPARGRAALQRVRDALIPARATMAEPDYAAAFRTLAERHRKRSLIVLFTDVIDVRASQALIAHTTRGAVRHLPLVVALRNDALVHAASPAARGDSGALFESAAAEELLSARDEALLKMRQAGVSVVDVSPHAMTAAVVNRYLEIKAKSAL